MAREIGDPALEALALNCLAAAAYYASDIDDALELARQARQIPADIPGRIARAGGQLVAGALDAAGDPAAAERIYADELARSREVGDLRRRPGLLVRMADLDLRAGRVGDAAAHLHEAAEIIARTGGQFELFFVLDCCGYLCAATVRRAAAVPAAAAMTPTPQPYLRGEYGPGPVAPVPATTRVIIAGGLAGWQITLIAVGAALLAATVAVVLDRARSARRAASAATA